jgi:hypothetical protein
MSEIDLCLLEIALCLLEIALPIKDTLHNDEVFILVPYLQVCLLGVIVNCEFIFVEHYGTFVILIVVGLNLAEWAEPLYVLSIATHTLTNLSTMKKFVANCVPTRCDKLKVGSYQQ